MPKIAWILNHYAQEPGGSGGTRHYSLARHLREQGWQCVLIAASTEYGTGRQRLSTREKTRRDTYDGVDFLWLRVPEYRGNGMSRIRNMLAYTVSVLRPAHTRDLPAPDLIVGSSVHPLAAWAGARLASRHRVPFIFEERDLWPETLIDMGKLSATGVPARLMLALERWLYRRAAVVVTPLPGAHLYMARHGVAQERVHWISNGVELDGVELDGPPLRIALPGEPFVFMYFGAHGQANGLEPVIHGFAKARAQAGSRNVRLRMIGDGPRKAALQQLAETLNLGDAISFEPAVPKSQIPALGAQADAFVVNLRDLPLYRYGISLNKLFDYLAAARPILFAGNAINNPVRDAGAGECVPADDADAIGRAMCSLADTPASVRAEMGAAGRRHVAAHYSYRHLAGLLARAFDKAVEQ